MIFVFGCDVNVDLLSCEQGFTKYKIYKVVTCASCISCVDRYREKGYNHEINAGHGQAN